MFLHETLKNMGRPAYKVMLMQKQYLISIMIYVITAYLDEPHMAGYGLTDIEDVGILVQNNEKTINGLHVERGLE